VFATSSHPERLAIVTADVVDPMIESTAPTPTFSARAIADPLPLGLTSFGVSVLLLALTQASVISADALPVSVLAISLTAGGIGHVLAGVLHFLRGEQFPGTVFLMYASFWFSYVLISQFYGPAVAGAGGDPTAAIGWFLVAFAIVTTVFFAASLATTRTLVLLFALLTVGFYLVAGATFSGSSVLGSIAGWVLVVDALVALYLAAGLILNATWGRTLLPTP
jgi:succinate-acetate transporter protein